MSNLNHLYASKKGVVFVDLSQIALSTTMATAEKGSKLDLKEVRHMILSTLKHNVLRFKNEGYEKIVITVDNAKFGYWRRQFADYYKRNRAISRDENKSDFDWEGYFQSLSIVIQELKDNMPYTVIDVKHAEADDCIAVLTKIHLALGWKVLICSSDGDFTQLHTCEDVEQWSPIQKKFVVVKTSSPEEDCLTKIIKGDKKDCVATIKVRGDFYLTKNDGQRVPSTSPSFITDLVGKTDEELFEIFKEDIKISYQKSDKTKKSGNTKGLEYLLKSLRDDFGIEEEKSNVIMANYEVDFIIDLLAKIRMKRFIENRVLIDFNYIREDIKQAIIEAHDTYEPAPRGKMYSYFVRSGLTKLINEINNF